MSSTEPTVGMSITWHQQEGDVSGHIVEVSASGDSFRFQWREWVRDAARVESTWRECNDCWPVTLGVAREGAREEPAFQTPLEALLYRLGRIEPWLMKRRWPPMSYMMIPGVLAGAQRLALELEQAALPLAAEKATYLRRLIAEFHRVP